MRAEAENRTAHRRATYTGGEILIGRTKVGCIVRDLSRQGARLEVKVGTPPLPDQFDLNIPDVLKQACRVMWRRGREVGVRFR